MVIFGVDAHKHTHTVVAVDEHGRQLGSRTVRTSTSDHLALLRWATQFPGRRQWAIEDCRHLSRRLERDLLGAGEVVVRVPPKLMANVRDCARTYGKSDPIDALAVARALLREPGLPAARLDGPERQVRLLVDHREDLVAERTRVIGRLRWRLHELDPTCLIHPGSRRSRAGPGQRLRRRPRTSGRAPRPRSAGPATRPDPGRALPVLTAQIDDLTAEIDARIGQLVPTLLAVVGVGPLTAASFSVRPPEWTASAARTPTPGSTAQHRSRSGPPTGPGTGSRTGNRQINAVNAGLHRIAMTQARVHPPAKAMIERRRAGGDGGMEALRVLKRRLSDVVYNALRADLATLDQRHAA